MFKLSRYPLMMVIVLLFAIAPVSKADSIENITVSGTATCGGDLCDGQVGPFSGTYTFDVTTQTVIGPWSISLPYTTISSTDAGSFADVSGASVEFGESNSSTLQNVTFVFPAGDLAEFGALASASNFCPSFGFSYGPPTCVEGAYQLVGTSSIATSAAPEPSESSLMLAGVLLVLCLAASPSVAARAKGSS